MNSFVYNLNETPIDLVAVLADNIIFVCCLLFFGTFFHPWSFFLCLGVYALFVLCFGHWLCMIHFVKLWCKICVVSCWVQVLGYRGLVDQLLLCFVLFFCIFWCERVSLLWVGSRGCAAAEVFPDPRLGYWYGLLSESLTLVCGADGNSSVLVTNNSSDWTSNDFILLQLKSHKTIISLAFESIGFACFLIQTRRIETFKWKSPNSSPLPFKQKSPSHLVLGHLKMYN